MSTKKKSEDLETGPTDATRIDENGNLTDDPKAKRLAEENEKYAR